MRRNHTHGRPNLVWNVLRGSPEKASRLRLSIDPFPSAVLFSSQSRYYAMSASIRAAGPSTNYLATVFDAASSEYQKITGIQLEDHSLSASSSLEDALVLLQTRTQVFVGSHNGDELMKLLEPIVRVLFTFSAMLGGPFSPARIIFTAIDILLSAAINVSGGYGALINIFERIHTTLQHLNVYTEISLTNGLTELLGKVMAQLLSILALSTRVMTEGRFKRFVKRLEGTTDVEDALSRLERFMNEESRLMAARTLELINRVDTNMKATEKIVHERKLGYPASTPAMSIGPSTDNFTSLFNAASSEYQKITGTQLGDSLPASLATFSSPDDVLALLQTRIRAFDGSHNGDELMLDPIVRVLFTFSARLREGINLPFSPARRIFTAIDILLSATMNVSGGYGTLIHLFEHIHLTLQRLNVYTEIPLTNELTVLLGKIMAQLLSILALSTRVMTEGRFKKFVKRLEGTTDIKDALSRLERLTDAESMLVAGRALELINRVATNIKATKMIVHECNRYSESSPAMSIGLSTDNFTALFTDASREYKKMTGKVLETHPFAARLGNCGNPKDVLDVLRMQAQDIDESHGDNELMKSLDPIVLVLSTLPAMLGEGISLPFSPAKTTFVAIDILLAVAKDVAGSYSTLIDLFERIHLTLQRLNLYTEIPLTNELTVLLGKIMAQLLSILALSTRMMTEGRFKRSTRRLEGRIDIENALSRLEMFMNEGRKLMAGRIFKLVYRVDASIEATKEIVHERKRYSRSTPTTSMSIGPSTDNFTALFTAASSEYQKVAGIRLEGHSLSASSSLEDVLDLLQTRTQVFVGSHNGDKVMKSLDPIVRVLFTFSATFGEGISLPFSPARIIFTAIDILLSATMNVPGGYGALINIFERIHLTLQRLNVYTEIPLTNELTELLGKVMAQLLSILALSTRVMTEGRFKRFVKRLEGTTDVEDALSRLEMFMNEGSRLMAARTLELMHRVDINTKVTEKRMHDLNRYQLQEKLRTWLSPPDPSVTHNNPCETWNYGTSMWFIKGSVFQEWKQNENGSLLWVSGNPGAGKTVLCSAVIENIKSTQKDKPVLVTYYYFDNKDAFKRDLRGLLASVLLQLSYGSDRCLDFLYQLYTTCGDGSQQPSDTALEECLKSMLELLEQPPFVIVDALDECPSNPGSSSVRQDVLNFVGRLVGSSHSKPFICIFSRPEEDIRAVLGPLTSPGPSRQRRHVSLHEERQQMEDINRYIRTFVDTNIDMRTQDKDLVIETLSSQAGGNFRWASFQVEMLRQCLPESIQKALEELPNSSLELEGSTTAVEKTYERALTEIPRETQQHAHILFQCLMAAFRPLRVEEIAAILFDLDSALYHVQGRGPKNVQDVLSPCSIFVDNIEHEGSRIIQFCHSSVKEFLTSDRLRTFDLENNSQYYISLDAAHATLAKRCLDALSQVNEHGPTTSPLALYAAEYWVKHAKFKDVASEIQGAMEDIFDPQRLAAWTRLHDVDRSWAPTGVLGECQWIVEPKGTPLYYAVLCGFSHLAERLITKDEQDVDAKCGTRGTPLHAASAEGHLDAVGVLLHHGADVNATDKRERTPLYVAHRGGHLEVMQVLLEGGAVVDLDERPNPSGFLLHTASSREQAEVVTLLLAHGANVNAKGISDWTPLHWASANGHSEIVDILIDHHANIDTLSTTGATPLRLASGNGHLGVVKRLLHHRADVHIQGRDRRTPYDVATSHGHRDVAAALLQNTR